MKASSSQFRNWISRNQGLEAKSGVFAASGNCWDVYPIIIGESLGCFVLQILLNSDSAPHTEGMISERCCGQHVSWFLWVLFMLHHLWL